MHITYFETHPIADAQARGGIVRQHACERMDFPLAQLSFLTTMQRQFLYSTHKKVARPFCG